MERNKTCHLLVSCTGCLTVFTFTFFPLIGRSIGNVHPVHRGKRERLGSSYPTPTYYRVGSESHHDSMGKMTRVVFSSSSVDSEKDICRRRRRRFLPPFQQLHNEKNNRKSRGIIILLSLLFYVFHIPLDLKLLLPALKSIRK